MARCVSPFRKKGETFDLPCGRCYACQARRISGWSFRLGKEAEVSTSAFFITLTYEPATVPLTKNNMMTLEKRDLQLFFKRLRKISPGPTIKYYAVGEYGDKLHRPHYHAIIFNASPDRIIEAWGLGDVYFGDVTPASCGYVLSYISKGSKIPLHQNDFRIKKFAVMSKKLGLNHVTPEMVAWHQDDPINRLYLTLLDGKKISMPRYYRRYFISPEQMTQFIEKQQLEEQDPDVRRKYLEDFELNDKVRVNKQLLHEKNTERNSVL